MTRRASRPPVEARRRRTGLLARGAGAPRRPVARRAGADPALPDRRLASAVVPGVTSPPAASTSRLGRPRQLPAAARGPDVRARPFATRSTSRSSRSSVVVARRPRRRAAAQRIPAAPGIFRVVLLIPWALAPVANAVLWKWIYNANYGILNAIVTAAGDHRRQGRLAGRPVPGAQHDARRRRLEGDPVHHAAAARRAPEHPAPPLPRGTRRRRGAWQRSAT